MQEAAAQLSTLMSADQKKSNAQADIKGQPRTDSARELGQRALRLHSSKIAASLPFASITGRALGAHVFLAIHALLHPDAVGFDELLVLVS